MCFRSKYICWLVFSLAVVIGCGRGNQEPHDSIPPTMDPPTCPECQLRPESFNGTYLDRDAYGTPQIYADSMPDAGYALGHAMAEDQLPGLLKVYMNVSGRLSEFFGRGTKDRYLEDDQDIRLVRLVETTEALYPQLSEDVRDYVEAFVEGINAYLDDHRDSVPWARDFVVTPQMVFATARWDMIKKQLRVAREEASLYGQSVCPDYVYEGNNDASNAWAVTAPLTAGETILGGDPHVPWDLDPMDDDNDGWFHYEAHFMVQQRRFGGAIPLGLPIIGMGYSDFIAQTGTHSSADIADVYRLEIVDTESNSYLFGSQERESTVRDYTILVYVDGSDPAEFEEVEYRVYDSAFGPMQFVDGGIEAFSALLPSIDAMADLEARFELPQVDTIDEVVEILETQEKEEANLIFASRQGEILYNLAARIPKRKPEICYALPLEASDASTHPEWDDDGKPLIAAFEDHPLIRTPASGALVNNNVSPLQVTTDIDELAWHNGLYDPTSRAQGGYRQRIIRSELEDAIAGQFDFEYSMELATDVRIGPWDHFRSLLEELLAVYPEMTDDPVHQQALEGLLDWNGLMTVDALPAALFTGWVWRMDAYNDDRRIAYSAPGQISDLTAQQLEGARDALIAPLTDADECEAGVIPYLSEVALVDVPSANGALVPWGDVHQLLLPGEVTSQARAMPGGNQFLQTLYMGNASKECTDYGMGMTDSGSSVLMHAVFEPKMRVYMMKPKGVSYDVTSESYGNMSDIYVARQFRQVVLDEPSSDAELLAR